MGSDSESQQNTTQTTEDKRLVVESGFGNTGALNAGNVSIVSQDKDFLEKSLKHLEAVNALDSERSKFLITEAGNTAKHLFDTGENLFDSAESVSVDFVDTGYQFANDLLSSAEKARIDSFKLGQDAISSAFNAVADFDNETKGQTLDNSQIIAALIGAGALILVTR